MIWKHDLVILFPNKDIWSLKIIILESDWDSTLVSKKSNPDKEVNFTILCNHCNQCIGSPCWTTVSFEFLLDFTKYFVQSKLVFSIDFWIEVSYKKAVDVDWPNFHSGAWWQALVREWFCAGKIHKAQMMQRAGKWNTLSIH